MKKNDWKAIPLNIVYSTNPDYNYEMTDDEEQATLPNPSSACAYSWIARTAVVKLLPSSPALWVQIMTSRNWVNY